MPKFVPTHDFHVCQGGTHRMQKGVEKEYAENHPMTHRLRAMGPAYVMELKKAAPVVKAAPIVDAPKVTKKATKKKTQRKSFDG